MSQSTATVFEDRDNVLSLQLTQYDATTRKYKVSDLSSVTRVVAKVGSVTIDSDSQPDAFDWTKGNGVLCLILGSYVNEADAGLLALSVYDPINVNGVLWISQQTGNTLQVNVVRDNILV